MKAPSIHSPKKAALADALRCLCILGEHVDKLTTAELDQLAGVNDLGSTWACLALLELELDVPIGMDEHTRVAVHLGFADTLPIDTRAQLLWVAPDDAQLDGAQFYAARIAEALRLGHARALARWQEEARIDLLESEPKRLAVVP